MRAEEFDHPGKRRRIAERGAQFVGGEPGQREKALRAVLLAQHPAECGQRQGLRIGAGADAGGWRSWKNCQSRLPVLERIVNLQMGLGHRMAKRILVVEDNDLNRKLFCDVLVSQGFAVEPVADGRDALDRARAFVPNLVIMDIQLPNVSGLDLIEAAKQDPVLRTIPVLAVTAYAGKGDEERIREAGAEGYLAKPVSIGPFMQAVRALI